jgi:preprotein translocase subunit SecG
MYGLLLALHILICFSLIVVILLQSGKGGGLAGGAFGGTAQTVFGGRGATDFVTRATMILGGAFFLTSLILALMSTRIGQPSRSLMQEEARKAAAGAPRQLPNQGTPTGQTQPSGQTPSGATPSGTAPSGQAPPSTTPPSGGAPATPTQPK